MFIFYELEKWDGDFFFAMFAITENADFKSIWKSHQKQREFRENSARKKSISGCLLECDFFDYISDHFDFIQKVCICQNYAFKQKPLNRFSRFSRFSGNFQENFRKFSEKIARKNRFNGFCLNVEFWQMHTFKIKIKWSAIWSKKSHSSKHLEIDFFFFSLNFRWVLSFFGLIFKCS